MDANALSVIENAYLKLLTMPPADPWRLNNQGVLISLRDYIAQATNTESQEVQNKYEEMAYMAILHNKLFG